MTRPPVRYPWLLERDHPLYRPFLGFAGGVMTPAKYRSAMARTARSFAREFAAYVIETTDQRLTQA